MNSLNNKVTLIGNVGKHLNLKAIENGHVLNMSMATNDTFGKGENKKQITDWHNCVAWNSLAESMAKQLTTGSRIKINGKLKTANYLNVKGDKVYSTQIEVTSFELIDKKQAAPTVEVKPVEEPKTEKAAAPKKPAKSKANKK
jgi:single-strand DNA-binding protein